MRQRIRCHTAFWAAVFAALSSPVWAQSSVSLTGTVDLALREVKNGSLGSIRSQVSGSNLTSKLVFSGTEDLGGGLSAGFFLDATLLPDTGNASGLSWDRRATVSLASRSLGELRLGRDWVPTHLVWSGFDPFTTLGIASANSFRSVTASRALGQAFGTTAAANVQNPTLRVNNAVEFFLPSGLGGVFGAVMLSAGEGGSAGAGATKGRGGQLGWRNAQAQVAIASYRTANANGDQAFTDTVIGASYTLAGWRGSVAQRRWSHGADRTTNTLLGLQGPVGTGQLRLSWLKADQQGATAAASAADAQLLGAGYVHPLSRRTALYAHVARLKNEGAAIFTVPGGPAVSASATAANFFGGQTSRAYEFGVRHHF